MSGEVALQEIAGPRQGKPETAKLNVIFVHGLGGDGQGTWTDDDAPLSPEPKGWLSQKLSEFVRQYPTKQRTRGPFWPRWLAEDLDGLAVYSLDYPANPLRWTAGWSVTKSAVAILDALTVDPRLRRNGSPIVFICHSLGGLVVKKLIVTADIDRGQEPSKGAFLDRVAGVVFLATPHQGAFLATFLTVLGWEAASASLRDLEADNDFLLDLGNSYRSVIEDDGRRIGHRVYYEDEQVVGLKIVNAGSADPGLTGVRPVAVLRDHFGVCKMQKRGQVYNGVFALLEEAVNRGPLTARKLKEQTKNDTFKKIFDKAAAPLTAFGLIVSTIAATAASWTKIVALFAENPIEVVVIGFLLSSGLAWFSVDALIPSTLKQRLSHTLRLLALIILATLSSALLISEPVCVLGCGKARWTPIKTGGFFQALAAEPQVLTVIDVFVDESRSTFRMTRDNHSIHGGEALDKQVKLGIEFDRSMLEVFENASCRGMNGEQPIEDALPVWRSLLEKRGRHDLAKRLADYNGYKTLVQKGGLDTFNAARPNLAEMVDLNKNKREWYELLMRWMVECVGVADPVVIWTLKNGTTKALTLSSVDYNVLDVSQVGGAGPETIEPIDVAPHDLDHSKGTQSRQIIPRIKIPPGDQAAFRIRYRMETTKPGYTWLIRPTFHTLEGIEAIGPEIKIFNAKQK